MKSKGTTGTGPSRLFLHSLFFNPISVRWVSNWYIFHFPFIFGMVFALNMSNPTRTGLRQCFLKRQTWTWTHKTHKFIYWFHKSGGIKLKTLQEKCCPFAPVECSTLIHSLHNVGSQPIKDPLQNPILKFSKNLHCTTFFFRFSFLTSYMSAADQTL